MKPSHLVMVPMLMFVLLMSAANMIAWASVGSTHLVIFAAVTVALGHELFVYFRDMYRLRRTR
jgi:hypothetical protein